MAAGKIIQSGTTSHILINRTLKFVANFVGTESILEGTVNSCAEGHMVISINGNQ